MTVDVFVPAFAAKAGATHPIAPVSVKVHGGILSGEIAHMQVVGDVDPRLTGTLTLRNTSETHSVRLVAATIQYLYDRWEPMALEAARAEATFTFAPDASDRLDPGQEAVQSVDVVFPAEALEPSKLKGLRLRIAYVSSPYREVVISFAASIVDP